jgi:H+/Cl- antiporter ClcA
MSCRRYDRSLVNKILKFLLLFNIYFSSSDYPTSQFVNGKLKGPTGLAGSGVHRAIWQLFIALIVQVALVTFTIGVKVPSGLIIPSMSIGAITGRIIGIITEQLAYQNPNFILFRNYCSKGK